MVNQKSNNNNNNKKEQAEKFLTENDILICDLTIETYLKIKDILDKETIVLTLNAIASKELPVLREKVLDELTSEFITEI